MKKYVLICALLLCSVSLYANPIFVDRYQTNFNAVEGWEMTDVRDGKSVSFYQSESMTTINISSYYYEEPVSANGFQRMRMTGYYDGWMNLFERTGTAEEAAKANVEESYVAVYSKHILGEQMKVTESLSGEYYFVKGHNAYVVSMITLKSNWAEAQDKLKFVLDSFWVGLGLRPNFMPVVKDTYGWKHFGGSVGNANEMVASPSMTSIMQEAWSADLGSSSERLLASSFPIVVDDAVVLISGGKIWSFNVFSGALNWSYALQEGFNHYLASDRGIIYLVNNVTHTLMALESETGRVVFREKLKTESSAPLVVKGKVYTATKKGLLVLSADTGKTITQLELDLDINYFPVMSDTLILLMTSAGELKAIDKKTKTVVWTHAVNGTAYMPIAYKQYVIVSSLHAQGDNSEILVLDSDTGKALWQFDYFGGAFSLSQMPSVGDDTLVFSAQIKAVNEEGIDEVQDLVMGLSVQSGESIWSQPYLAPDSGGIRPIVSESFAFINGGDTSELFYIDMVTGEKLPVSVLKGELGSQKSSLISARLYKQAIVKLSEEDAQVKLSVDI
jgi:outer membrane protein assembly factor BamB